MAGQSSSVDARNVISFTPRLHLRELRADFGFEAVEEFCEWVAAEWAYQDFVYTDCGEAVQVVGDFGGGCQDAFDVAAGVGPFWREAQVHAVTYREAVEVAAAACGEFANPSDTLRDLVGIHPRSMPSVAQLDGAADCATAGASDPDRNVAGCGARAETHPGEIEKLAVKFGNGGRPRRAHQRDCLVGVRAALFERYAECAEFGFEPSAGDSRNDAARRQPVERGEFLGEMNRVAIRHDNNAGGELDPASDCGDVRERRDRFQYFDRRQASARLRDDQVIADPD